MNSLLAWFMSNYEGIAKYFLGIGVALVVAVLGTALPQIGWTSKFPARLAAAVGVTVATIALSLTAGKLAWPRRVSQPSWAYVLPTFGVGLALIAAAWLLGQLYRQRWRQRLQPMVDAAFRTLMREKNMRDQPKYVQLQIPGGTRALGELVSMARNRNLGPTMLVAPHGAGKTTLLLEFGAQCQVAWQSEARKMIVPIYLDMAQVFPVLSKSSLRQCIVDQLSHDSDLANLYAETWRLRDPHLIWVFIFDNVEVGYLDDSWLAELHDLLATNTLSLRAILSGCQVPQVRKGVRLELLPLEGRSRDDLMTALGVSSGQRATLNSEKSFRQYVGNPGWLQLVRPCLIQRSGIMDNFQSVMDDLISRRLAAKGGPPRKHSDTVVRATAESVACFIHNAEGPSRHSQRHEIVEYLQVQQKKIHDEIEAILDELIELQIMIPNKTFDNHEFLRFQHDSVRDYFTTCQMLGDPSSVDFSSLLAEPTSTTIAISLLQHGSEEVVGGMVGNIRDALMGPRLESAGATVLVNKFLDAMQIRERRLAVIHKESGPLWHPAVHRLLHVLDAGTQHHITAIPEDVRELADSLVAEAIPSSTLHEQAQMLDVQRILSPDVAAGVCVKTLRSRNGHLVRTAATQVTMRHILLDLFSVKDRIRFMLVIALAGLDIWAPRDAKPEFEERLRLASATGIVSSWLFAIVFGLKAALHLASQPYVWGGYILDISIAVVTAGGIACVRRYEIAAKKALADGVILPYSILIGLTVYGCLGLLSMSIGILTGNLGTLSVAITVGTLLWPMCALYYLATEPSPSRNTWRWPFATVAFPIWASMKSNGTQRISLPSKRGLLEGVVITGVVGFLLLAAAVRNGAPPVHVGEIVLSHHTRSILAWVFGTVAVALMFALPGNNYVHYLRWMRRRSPLVADGDAGQVLDAIGHLRTVKGTVNFLLSIEKHSTAGIGSDVGLLLTDLSRVLEWTAQLGVKNKQVILDDDWEKLPPLATKNLADWLRKYDGQHRGRLAKLAQRHRVALSEYLFDLAGVGVRDQVLKSRDLPSE